MKANFMLQLKISAGLYRRQDGNNPLFMGSTLGLAPEPEHQSGMFHNPVRPVDAGISRVALSLLGQAAFKEPLFADSHPVRRHDPCIRASIGSSCAGRSRLRIHDCRVLTRHYIHASSYILFLDAHPGAADKNQMDPVWAGHIPVFHSANRHVGAIWIEMGFSA